MSAAGRMRRFRREKPGKAQAIERRRTDERRRLEHLAAAYVRVYLQRGRIVPPASCDHCGTRNAKLRPWHPDPVQKKKILWLCPSDRRLVPALGEPVVLHWEWPGLTRPARELELQPVFEPRMRRTRHDRRVHEIVAPVQEKWMPSRPVMDLAALDALIAETNDIVDAAIARVKTNIGQ